MNLRILATAVLLVLAAVLSVSAKPDVPRITTDELKNRLGEVGLAIVDVRITGDWNKSDKMIAGSIRGNPNDMGLWRSKLDKDQIIILYCS